MIRSNGFVFTAMDMDVLSAAIAEYGDILVKLHVEDDFYMTPEEARELANALFLIADAAEQPAKSSDAQQAAPEGFFFSDVAPAPQQGLEDPTAKLRQAFLSSKGFDIG